MKKEGPFFDLAIALSYMLAAGDIKFNSEKKIFLGELGLDGTLRRIRGALPLAEAAKKHGFEEIYPKSHKKHISEVHKNGGFLSDFWHNDELIRENFLKRNRIVAGISEATIVIESAEKGGSLVTADIANLDNTLNARINSKVSNAAHYGDIKAFITGSDAYYVIGINGTRLLDLPTGILKNTTGTGVPSIAVASDFPTLNQSTTGNAATSTKLSTSKNINGVAFDGTSDITIAADVGTLTGNTLKSTVINSSLTSVGTLTNLTVTNTINGSVNGSAASATTANKLTNARNINGTAFDGTSDVTITSDAGTLTGTTLKSSVINSSLTSVGTLANLTVTNSINGSITGNASTVKPKANAT